MNRFTDKMTMNALWKALHDLGIELQGIDYLDAHIFPRSITADKFTSAQSVKLTGDVTGTASSQAGWSITTTLKNSGATAGSYGPSADANPAFGGTFSVPYITVDAKGRTTSISTKTIKIPSTLANASTNGLMSYSDQEFSGNKTFTGLVTATTKGFKGPLTGNVTGNLTGNASTASAFAEAKKIALTGDVTGSASSAGGWTIATTLKNSGATAGSYGPSANATPAYGATFNVPYITVDAKGIVTAISTKTVKIPAWGTSVTGSSGSCTGNAATATKFSAAQSVTLSGDVTGTASSQAGWSITTTLANSGATAGSYGPSANASPAFAGTFSVPYVTVDAKGRVTAASTKTITLPATAPSLKTTIANGASACDDQVFVRAAMAKNDAFGLMAGGTDDSGWGAIFTTDNGTEPIYVRQYTTAGYTADPPTAAHEATLLDASGNTKFPGTVTAAAFSGPLTGNVTGNVTGNCSGSSGSCTGNAKTATTLATARTIAISGGATGTATSFNGSTNITIPVTALDVSKATAGTLAVARGGTGQTSIANIQAGKDGSGNTITSYYCTLSTAQTVTACKTFKLNNQYIKPQYTDITKGTAPSANHWSYQEFLDSAGTRLGWIGHNYNTDNSHNLRFEIVKQDATTAASIGVGFDKNKAAYAWAPNPATASNSTNIATTSWVMNLANRRQAFVGQSGSTNTNPWYKFASFAATVANDDPQIVFLVEKTYGNRGWGILRCHVRLNGSIKYDACAFNLLADTGLDPAKFMLVAGTTEKPTIELWVKIDEAYLFYRFMVLSEGKRTSNGTVWTLYNASSAGQAANPTSGTQVAASRTITNSNPTLAWGTKSTIGTVHGVGLTVTMPAKPDTGTKYSAGTGLTLSGTTFSVTANTYAAYSHTHSYLPLSGGTMTGTITSNSAFIHKNGTAVKGTAPSSNVWYQAYQHQDKNGKVMSAVEFGYKTTKENRINLIVYPANTADASGNVQIAVGYDGSGNWFTYCPTPVADSNTTMMATTAWVRTYCESTKKFLTSHQSLSNYLTKLTNVSEMGRYIDLHNDNATAKYDYDVRMQASTQGDAAGRGNLYITANEVVIDAYSSNQLRLVKGNYGFLMRNDGSNFYFLLTASGSAGTGSWTSARPLTVNCSTGVCNINGNAATATTLATARTINGVSFNGSANITVADSTKLPLSGGTLTGNLTIGKSSPYLQLKSTDVTKATAPSANYTPVAIEHNDSAGRRLWGIYYNYNTDKQSFVRLIANSGTTTNNTWAGIGVGYDGSGNWFTYAPTPATADNSTKIATTAYVKAQGYITGITKAQVTTALGYTPPTSDTNTHFTTNIAAGGSKATANAAVSNPYIAVRDDSTYRSQVQLKGSGATTVSSDANGVITISSTDTNTNTWTAFKGCSSSAAGTAGYVPAPAKGDQAKYFRADGTWQVPPDTNTVYTHPTTAGNKHIPSGGSSGQFLGWSADGTAKWVNNPNTNTTYSAGTGLTLSGTTFSVTANTYAAASHTHDSLTATGDHLTFTTTSTGAAYVFFKTGATESDSMGKINCDWAFCGSNGTVTTDGSKNHKLGGFHVYANQKMRRCQLRIKEPGTSTTEYYFGAEISSSGYYNCILENHGKTGSMFANTTKTLSCGNAQHLWTQLYANTTTISTSDERQKSSIRSVPNEFLDAWADVNWVQYQFNDAIEKKGTDAARIHTGIIAQRVRKAFEDHNLDITKHSFFCYDQWDRSVDEETGKVTEAGDAYAIRYEEALCIEAAYQRRRADKAEARIAELEDRLTKVESLLAQLVSHE